MLIFTENRNQFNPLMQKIAIFAAAAALLASCAPARNAFVINGNIRALPDSTEILLYSVRDDGLMQVVDTALSENGKFVLECAPDSAQELSIVARSLGSSLLTVYAEPGEKAGISGDAGNVMLWKVRSRVPEQREYNRYLENVWTEIGEQARLREEIDSLGNMLYGMDDRGTDEAKALLNLVRKCREREDSVVKVRYDKTLDLLAASKVSRISTEELSGIIRMIGYYPEKYGELRDRAAEQYERLSDEVKASPEGRDMKAFLSVTDRVKVGDRFFDGEFRDLDGGTHRLSDTQVSRGAVRRQSELHKPERGSGRAMEGGERGARHQLEQFQLRRRPCLQADLRCQRHPLIFHNLPRGCHSGQLGRLFRRRDPGEARKIPVARRAMQPGCEFCRRFS